MARLLAKRLAEMNVNVQFDYRATTRRSP